MDNAGVIAFLFAVLLALPVFFIASLNALFHLGIEYGISEIFSAYFLMMIFSGGSVKSFRSKD